MLTLSLENYTNWINLGFKILLIVTGGVVALIGSQKSNENIGGLKDPKAPFLFIGTTSLASYILLADLHSYLSSVFPNINDVFFEPLFCLGFASYSLSLATIFKNWANSFLAPLTPVLLSATSFTKFISFLNSPIDRIIFFEEEAIPSEVLKRVGNFMVMLLVFQSLGIALLLFSGSTSLLAESWIRAISLISCLIWGGMWFSSFVLMIYIWTRKPGVPNKISKK